MDALTNKDNHFLNLLGLIRKRPMMYFRTFSIISLSDFIFGYNACECKDGEIKSYFDSQKPSFYDWIHMKENSISKPDLGWVETLGENSSSDEEAFNKFFHYLDDFLIREPKVIHKEQLTESVMNNYQKQAIMDDDAKPVRVEMVSYDTNVNGVFLRFFDKNNIQINEERLCGNKEYAFEYLDSLKRGRLG